MRTLYFRGDLWMGRASWRAAWMNGAAATSAWLPRTPLSLPLWFRFAALGVLVQLWSAWTGLAQEPGFAGDRLPPHLSKNGSALLRSFAPLAARARNSVVKLDRDGSTFALGAVIHTNGLAITKASEIRNGKLTSWLADGREVGVELLATDEETDVALVQVQATTLTPIEWAEGSVSIGQWAVTPGIRELPQAAGVVSVLPRKIQAKRALIGVQLDQNSAQARIGRLMEGFGAEKAGLKPGDLILAVDGANIDAGEELIDKLREYRGGQTVKLRVKRGEDEFDASITMTTPNADAEGGGLDREERMNRMGGDLSERAEGFELALQHDTVLQPWLCGGPLLNLEGKAIGLNIARAGRTASYALPAELVEEIIDKLRDRAGIPEARN